MKSERNMLVFGNLILKIDIWVSLHLITKGGLLGHILKIDCMFLSICSQH